MLEQRNVEQFYAAAENEPDKAYALTVMGEAEAAQEDYANANKHYQRAIELNPAIAQAYFGLGQILHQKGRIQEALQWYEDALERAPNNRRYLHNLAATLAENNQPELAEAKYRALLNMDDSQLLAYAELVELLQQQNKTAAAKQLAAQAQQGLVANPDWPDKPLNAQTWFVWQEGETAYLDDWATKQKWLNQVFAVD
jgi:tetratricopeptide (TPR) repeat protein